jgi:hypothetical protein
MGKNYTGCWLGVENHKTKDTLKAQLPTNVGLSTDIIACFLSTALNCCETVEGI